MSEKESAGLPEVPFTQGPWAVHDVWPFAVVPEDHRKRSMGGSVHEKDDRDRYALRIASADFDAYSTFAHEIPKEQAKANARLIAAAPDLLAALEAIHQGFVDGSIHWTKKRQSESDPYHPANTLMSLAFEKVRGDAV